MLPNKRQRVEHRIHNHHVPNKSDFLPFGARIFYNKKTFNIKQRLTILKGQEWSKLLTTKDIQHLCSGYFRINKINPRDVSNVVSEYLGTDLDRCELNFDANCNNEDGHNKRSEIWIDYPYLIQNERGICFTVMRNLTCDFHGSNGRRNDFFECGILGILKSDQETINKMEIDAKTGKFSARTYISGKNTTSFYATFSVFCLSQYCESISSNAFYTCCIFRKTIGGHHRELVGRPCSLADPLYQGNYVLFQVFVDEDGDRFCHISKSDLSKQFTSQIKNYYFPMDVKKYRYYGFVNGLHCFCPNKKGYSYQARIF